MDDLASGRPPPALAGRSVQMVSDLLLEEQLYLYERTRLLKAKSQGRSPQESASQGPPLCAVEDHDIDEKVEGQDNTVYLVFMEGSTRTKESLRNAAAFHGVKVNEFQAESSSFQKNETITDTMKMLTVYSTQRSVFVVRSQNEGVCSWLQTVMPGHAAKFGIPTPSFVNAGDGRNSHPLSELADIYSLLEASKWNRQTIHIALVGDLKNGRTAHSKVDGLLCFKNIRVDLVAPGPLGLPIEYKRRMELMNFEVRTYDSTEEYIARETRSTLATLWYFFQPKGVKRGTLNDAFNLELRGQISFRPEWRQKLREGTRFFQTLPRDKEHPLIPLSFDQTPLNGWDAVSSNAYFLHVVMLSMLFGKIGHSTDCANAAEKRACSTEESWMRLNSGQAFSLTQSLSQHGLPEFIECVDVSNQERERAVSRAAEGGSVPLENGLVVDHIGLSTDSSDCWAKVRMLRFLLGWMDHIGTEGVYSSRSRSGRKKGLLALPDYDLSSVTVKEMKMIASIAPGCTVNAIQSSKVVGKFRLTVPERIYNLPNIACKSKLCIANPENKQRDVVSYFDRVPFYETSALPKNTTADYLYLCKYCRWPHTHADIWL
jgi:aspartate carbamoyltransferase